jgi:hypothetical protein
VVRYTHTATLPTRSAGFRNSAATRSIASDEHETLSTAVPSPLRGIKHDDKIPIGRVHSAARENIEQLSINRRNLSLVKGDGVARARRAGQLVSLITSNVLLDLIASGRTIPHLPILEPNRQASVARAYLFMAAAVPEPRTWARIGIALILSFRRSYRHHEQLVCHRTNGSSA